MAVQLSWQKTPTKSLVNGSSMRGCRFHYGEKIEIPSCSANSGLVPAGCHAASHDAWRVADGSRFDSALRFCKIRTQVHPAGTPHALDHAVVIGDLRLQHTRAAAVRCIRHV